MSQAWMPMYWGDYLRDTGDLTTLQHGAYLLLIAHYWQHGGLPPDERRLAVIAGLSFKQWKAIRGPIAEKFEDGWTHKRVARELIELERKMVQRSRAGTRGGIASGLSKNIKAGHEANASLSLASRYKKYGKIRSENEAGHQAKTKRTNTNHQEYITTTTTVAAREAAAVENNPAVGPATALPTGAPSRPPGTTNGEAKRPPRKEGKEALPPGTPVTQAEYMARVGGKP